MLVLILSDFQYSQKAVFSFEKYLNRQNHSSSGFFNPVNKFRLSGKFLILPSAGEFTPPTPYFYLGNPGICKLKWD